MASTKNDKNTAKNEKSKKSSSKLKYLGGLLFKKMARGGANELGTNADEVNKLNVFPVPDGDTGDNMHMTIESGINAMEQSETDNLSDVMKALSRGMLLGARGNSGVILSQFFAGTAKGLEKSKKADPKVLAHALSLGVKQAYSSVMTPTEGTILTVAREAVDYATSRLKDNSTIRSFFADLVKEMRASLKRTPDILKVLKDAKVVDSGAAGLYYIMDGFYRVLNGEDVSFDKIAPQLESASSEISFDKDSEMVYGYCTELLLQLMSAKCDPDKFDIEALKSFLSEIGDSIVAFKTESIVKIHVHTFTPEKVLAHCRQYGEFLKVKIENMSVQHNDTEQIVNAPQAKTPQPTTDAEKKKYGVVAVCSGSGVVDLYREFGADEIIIGGQTKNPSTNDFLEAFGRVAAHTIFVFPNNGNVFMAAGQAADMYTDAKVLVVPSKNIGMGYVALSCADFECDDAYRILSEMTDAMSGISTGFISPSIRDADLNGIHVNNGDTIGIIDKEIVVSAPERMEAALALAEKLLSGTPKAMLTVFCGEDIRDGEEELFKNALSLKHPDIETYFIEGNQEIYSYIFVAE